MIWNIFLSRFKLSDKKLPLATEIVHKEICKFISDKVGGKNPENDKNQRANDGWTPLHAAAKKVHLEKIRENIGIDFLGNVFSCYVLCGGSGRSESSEVLEGLGGSVSPETHK